METGPRPGIKPGLGAYVAACPTTRATCCGSAFFKSRFGIRILFSCKVAGWYARPLGGSTRSGGVEEGDKTEPKRQEARLFQSYCHAGTKLRRKSRIHHGLRRWK